MPNVIVKGKGKQSLGKGDFVAAGGEGEVYAKGDIAYKIYTDPTKMIPEGKINELSALKLPNIIRPIDIILDSKMNSIGYTMRFVKNTYSICQIFTKAFRNRNNIDGKIVLNLVEQLQKGVSHVHSNNILIVDCNEFNFLINDAFDQVFFIDVDSYQTPHYNATAIMDSIRDRHVKNNHFTKESDWFAWGILTFQMFIGIHPFKGQHKTLKTLDDRMIKNISVFNKDVLMPGVCEPLSSIPQVYRDWYKAVFEDGKRIAPPTGGAAVVIIAAKVDMIVGSDKFEIKKVEDFTLLGSIVDVYYSFGKRLVHGTKSTMIDLSFDNTVPADAKIGFTPQLNQPISSVVESGFIKLHNLSTGKPIADRISGHRVMTYEGRMFARDAGAIYEIKFIEMPLDTRATSSLIANVLDNATTMYDGVVIQNLLEATYVSIFPQIGIHYQIRIKELEKTRIIDAKFDRNVLQVVSMKKGKYDRYVFRFSKDYSSYDVRVEHDVTFTGFNFVVLDSGTCVQIDEKECINVFRNVKDDPRLTIIDDPAISGDMRLIRWAGQAMMVKGKSLYSFKMK